MNEQEKREKVIRGLEFCIWKEEPGKCEQCPYYLTLCIKKDAYQLKEDAIALLKAQEPITGDTSDGYHTFNELYHHRAVLFSVIVANYPNMAWKSKKHHDGTMYDGMFIVGIDTPDGQATYHYDVDPYWDMFKCRVLDNAPEWDGHTPAQAIERIGKLKAQEPHVIRFDEIDDYEVLWLEVRDVGTEEGLAPWVKTRIGNWFSPLLCSELQPDMILSTPEEYGKYCRCWTSRPTDEQRKAVKWDG